MVHVAKRWRIEYVAFLARLEGITLRHFRCQVPPTRSRPIVREPARAPERRKLARLAETHYRTGARMRFRRTLAEPDEPIELNLIPLIDVIMFLLIFFISTTSFIEEPGIQVDKPQAASARQIGQEQHHLCGHARREDRLRREGNRTRRRAAHGQTAVRQGTLAGGHSGRRECPVRHGDPRD